MVESKVPGFDETRLNAFSKPRFEPFDLQDSHERVPLERARLGAGTELIVVERNDAKLAVLVNEMLYHHIVQGNLGGVPFMLTFCGVCHSGIGMTPVVDGSVTRFNTGGVYNGTMILKDDDTGTFWDHMTGQALYGPSAGKKMQVWPVEMTTAGIAMQSHPGINLVMSHQKQFVRGIQAVAMAVIHWTGLLPNHFQKTLGREDKRFPRMTLGLGVVVNEKAKFYPLSALEGGGEVVDQIGGAEIRVAMQTDGIPHALLADGTRPLQYYLRFYGFALTYQCDVYNA